MVHLEESVFGKVGEDTVKCFTWTTGRGLVVSAISYGAIVQKITLPDKYGTVNDVVLGFDDLDGYLTRNTPYLGATVGRVANRIGGATFEIDGVRYDLAKNIGKDHLHGGVVGFDKKNWHTTVDGNRVTFSYLSPDGEEGYPGDLLTNLVYEVTDDNCLHMQFQSTTTKKTVLNLTNHSYFNLAGHDTGAQEVYDHNFVINADTITETDSGSIPTGRFVQVGGTAYDLRVRTRLGDVIDRVDGYDDNFCVNTYGNKGLNFVARADHPVTGRYLEIHCDQPGVQFYTSNGMPGPEDHAIVGKDGVGYRRHGAFCLETQLYPDAVHHPNFPTAILNPGDIYKHHVVYKFGVEKEDRPSVTSN